MQFKALYMKHFIFFIFLILPLFGYGQDFIVTKTGDSIKCKINGIDDTEIQFRLDQTNPNKTFIFYLDGIEIQFKVNPEAVITVKKSDETSQQYDFFSQSSTTDETTAEITPETEENKEFVENIRQNNASKQKNSSKCLPFYASISAGKSAFGSLSYYNITNGGPFVLGADVAYFFKNWIGAGIKMNLSFSKVYIDNEFLFDETITFIGPALYGRFGNKKLAFVSDIGIGTVKWKTFSDNTLDGIASTVAGGYLSAGINYILFGNFGVCLKLQTIISSNSDNEDYERKPAGIGGALGVNFKF